MSSIQSNEISHLTWKNKRKISGQYHTTDESRIQMHQMELIENWLFRKFYVNFSLNVGRHFPLINQPSTMVLKLQFLP